MDVDEGPSTDEDTAEEPAVPKFGGALPNFFDGYTFAIDDEHSDAEQLSRYIKAYGGLTLQLSEVEEDSEVDYVVGGAGAGAVGGARRVSAGWVARCHRARALLPPD
ncbi:unnamed protein product [Arctia plantaginis]|uniref:BRCT domain-containing protein n=1 Tax=Arctia plantaginis TaxID=874455 RepID=A0A8S0Z621_ARCPL|nr:unnamed protein product [Arctia plantaginis]CAB3228167.1 unnamed protein product [Arctia plantaginis]